MCEPPDILRRHNNKMIKPTIAHNGNRPQSVFLYMYPVEPKFDVEEVGLPVFLTPYIKSEKLSTGREKAQVYLKEFPELISYAGFLTVEEKYNSNMYFWFFPSRSDPTSDPVALWLQVLNVYLRFRVQCKLFDSSLNMNKSDTFKQSISSLGRSRCNLTVRPIKRKRPLSCICNRPQK